MSLKRTEVLEKVKWMNPSSFIYTMARAGIKPENKVIENGRTVYYWADECLNQLENFRRNRDGE